MLTDAAVVGASDLTLFAHTEALVEPEKLLAAYFSLSTVGVCILDSGLRYLAINNTLAEMNGIPPADHLGKTLREILGPAAGAVESHSRRAFVTGDSVYNIELSVVLPTRTEAGHWI